MTAETRLRTAMAQAVAPTIPDTEQLVSTARRQGLGIRRRRQALGSVGVAAALAAAVLVPTFVAGDHDGDARNSTLVGSVPRSFDPSDTTPFTGRSTAAALIYAVGLEATGTATDVHGSSTDRAPIPDAYAFIRFTPDGSETAGQVAINVQPNWVGYGGKPGDEARGGGCQAYMTRCTSTRLADGSRLTTYDDRSSYGSGGIRRVASLYRPDDVRIVVSASNGFDVTELDEQVTRDEPVLTTEQLIAVATQAWWGPRLPSYFTEQGKRLDDFTGQDDLTANQPVQSPTTAPIT